MIIKKYFLAIYIISLGFFQIGFLQKSDNSFEEKANNAGINLEYLKEQTTISRYDVTRLLNAVECIDCINPSNKLIDTYTNNFWVNFTTLPGKDFDDIFYKKAIYNNQSYYYCVASVADKEYMFGYPILTSPLCPGEFCGSNNMTRGEFVQVITNILSKYIRKNYTTNWKKIKTWYENQTIGSYSYNIFNEKDKSIIINKAEQCEDINCSLGGSSEFRTYLKYCMFNLEECQMQEFGRISQGYWPIAELNIAIKEGIIINNESFINTIHKSIDGKTAVEAFGRIFPKIQCNFDNDYDCDGISNSQDNCPNYYNPSQTDTDSDTIGDVCDDDIDGDGINNPIGIVDERGGTNINLRTNSTDNCLFVQNNNQDDHNNNYQGDACEICKSIPSFCLLQKTKGIESQCDIDGDGIDDRCDDDIDGDGVKNPIGLIIENHSSCDISKATIDIQKRNSLMNSLQDKILRNASCISIDNCPLLANIEQDNSNLSPQGNLCEAISYNLSSNNSLSGNFGTLNSLDSDGDGVSDLLDKCPLTKETKNGYEDFDGCPEICGDNDVDCDGILNQNDNCPNHYNPSQTDTDNDTIGDVCDDDIDGDGINNPIGIVDERGGTNINLRTNSTDNCLFIQNNNQQDNNNNYQGDVCDLSDIKGVSIGTNIIGTGENRKIYAYIITDYSPIENDRIRNIDGKNLVGKNILYDITKSGIYTLYVQSKSDPRRKASTSLMTEYNKGYTNANLSLSLSKEYLPTILTAKVNTTNSPDNIIRNLEGPDNQTKTTKNSLINAFLIRKKGNYILTSTLKNKNNETIGITSRSFVIENENNNIQDININTLTPLLGEQITININNTIKERKVNRGDSTSDIQSKNNISHTYTKDGVYIIESTITLSDNTKISDYKTIITKKDNKNNSKILQVKPFVLEGISQSPINLIIKRIGYTDTNIITRYSYDGITFSTGTSTSIGGYNDAGIYYPETKEIFGICQYTANQSTVVINNNSFSCLNMKIKNIKAQCDMDGDGIDDRCDDDIDGDSIKNPIGLIIENHSSCDITKAIIDKDKRDSMMNQLKEKEFNNICKSLDNCPLQSNNDQVDDNNNGLGNQCENNQYNFGNSNNYGDTNNNNGNNQNGNNDSDNDGINNDSDSCPTISETYNGYQDSDGCPELGNNNICNTDVLGDSNTNGDPTVGFECLQCPCQYAQESADINPGDTIRATLRNISGSILQSRSTTKTL